MNNGYIIATFCLFSLVFHFALIWHDWKMLRGKGEPKNVKSKGTE